MEGILLTLLQNFKSNYGGFEEQFLKSPEFSKHVASYVTTIKKIISMSTNIISNFKLLGEKEKAVLFACFTSLITFGGTILSGIKNFITSILFNAAEDKRLVAIKADYTKAITYVEQRIKKLGERTIEIEANVNEIVAQLSLVAGIEEQLPNIPEAMQSQYQMKKIDASIRIKQLTASVEHTMRCSKLDAGEVLYKLGHARQYTEDAIAILEVDIPKERREQGSALGAVGVGLGVVAAIATGGLAVPFLVGGVIGAVGACIAFSDKDLNDLKKMYEADKTAQKILKQDLEVAMKRIEENAQYLNSKGITIDFSWSVKPEEILVS